MPPGPMQQPTLPPQRESSLLAETASRQEVMNMQQITMKMMSGSSPNKHEVGLLTLSFLLASS
jgi:hypothetical protein